MDLKKFLRITVTVVVVVPFVWINLRECSTRDQILHDHSHTSGWLVRYSSIGDAQHASLTYHYRVAGRTYERTISPDVDFRSCLKDFSLCANRKFLVIYSNTDPEESLIDLTREIIGSEKIDLPKVLDDFE